MKLLIKTALLLATLFISTFLIIKVTGVLTIDDIKQFFENIKAEPAYIVGGLVVLLLFADLFIAVPTMTVILLAGFFLGFNSALLYAFIGLFFAAITGYILSRTWGEKILIRIERDKQKRDEMHNLFNQHGVLVLILSRAMPVLPEVSACLAGASKMPFIRFLWAWGLGTIPYLLIVSYAGSVSDVDNPTPAILTAIGVTATLWLAWMGFLRFQIQGKSKG